MLVRLIQPLRPDGRDERTSLSLDRDYTVLAIECGTYRLLNDFGEPTLYDRDAFACTCNERPTFWVSIHNNENDYDGPECWNAPGYFEDWHDHVPSVKLEFKQTVNLHYPEREPDLIPRKRR